MTDVSFARPELLALAVMALATLLAWWRWPPPLVDRRRRLALGLRLVLIIFLVLALAGFEVVRAPDRRVLMAVVDLSDSTLGARDAMAEAVRALARAKQPDDLFGVVTFGRDAQVEVAPDAAPGFDDFQTRPDGSYSDIAGALRLAANLIPSGYGRQLVLVSDGNENLGDAAAAVDGLRSQGVRVDVLGTAGQAGPEALVAALDVPSELRAGESLTATARLRATAPGPGQLTFQVGDTDVETRPLDLPANDSSQTFAVSPLPPGVHRLRATLDASLDTYSRNNVAEAVVRVLGPPAVLVLEGSPEEGANLAAAMESAGMRVDRRPVAEAPTDAAALAGYDSIVVGNAQARDFPEGSLLAITAAVRDLGRGLVAVGGDRAYGAGGWRDSPLEEALPVRMERKGEQDDVAVVFVVENMEHPFGDSVARTAINSVVDRLTATDEIGFVAVDMPPRLVVPLQPASDTASVRQRVHQTYLGDPFGYGASLEMAFGALATSTASGKHVVLIGDGDALGDRASYPDLIAGARSQRVTLSVVGVDVHGAGGVAGPGGDPTTYMEHMEDLAGMAGGPFYLSSTWSDLPELLLDKSEELRPWYELEPFFPTVTSAGNLLAGVPLDAFPQLDGYVATTAKARSEVALSTPQDDPLLAGWQYGLGRAVAWTSDANGRWTAGFLDSPVSGALFARMAAWSMPAGGGEPLRLEATPSGNGLDITATGSEGGGDLAVRIVSPDSTSASYPIVATGPGRWQATVPAAQIGTYVIRAVLRRADVDVGSAEISVAVPYPPEYLELGNDEGLLRQLVSQGGQLLAGPSTAWTLPMPAVAVTSELYFALVALVAVLWPLDVALRRLSLGPRQLLSVFGSLIRLRRPSEVEVALPPSLARARARIDAQRRPPPGPGVGQEEQAPAEPARTPDGNNEDEEAR